MVQARKDDALKRRRLYLIEVRLYPIKMILKSSEVMHVSITLFRSIIVVFSNIPNIQTKCGEYLAKYSKSHITLLQILIMLCYTRGGIKSLYQKFKFTVHFRTPLFYLISYNPKCSSISSRYNFILQHAQKAPKWFEINGIAF